jgi:hypothetical protein
MRRTATLLAAALTLCWTTACEPPPPPASFTVNVAPGVTGGDATPGDGVCETAPGNGVCTLDAAVQEGNALGRADIHVPQVIVRDNPFVLAETTITGQLLFSSEYEYDVREFEIRASDLQIAPGGRLSLEQVDLHITGTATVEGALLMHRLVVSGWIDISDTGLVSLVNAWAGVWASSLPTPASGAWVTNRGTFVSRFSFLSRNMAPAIAPAIVHTLDGGSTGLGANLVSRGSITTPDCLGNPPVSEGYNSTRACGLDSVGDIDDGSNGFPLTDIPLGAVGCGTDVTIDWWGHARPAPDGPPRCSRGSWTG